MDHGLGGEEDTNDDDIYVRCVQALIRNSRRKMNTPSASSRRSSTQGSTNSSVSGNGNDDGNDDGNNDGIVIDGNISEGDGEGDGDDDNIDINDGGSISQSNNTNDGNNIGDNDGNNVSESDNVNHGSNVSDNDGDEPSLSPRHRSPPSRRRSSRRPSSRPSSHHGDHDSDPDLGCSITSNIVELTMSYDTSARAAALGDQSLTTEEREEVAKLPEATFSSFVSPAERKRRAKARMEQKERERQQREQQEQQQREQEQQQQQQQAPQGTDDDADASSSSSDASSSLDESQKRKAEAIASTSYVSPAERRRRQRMRQREDEAVERSRADEAHVREEMKEEEEEEEEESTHEDRTEEEKPEDDLWTAALSKYEAERSAAATAGKRASVTDSVANSELTEHTSNQRAAQDPATGGGAAGAEIDEDAALTSIPPEGERQKAKRAAIQRVMKDASLSPRERNLAIQTIMKEGPPPEDGSAPSPAGALIDAYAAAAPAPAPAADPDAPIEPADSALSALRDKASVPPPDQDTEKRKRAAVQRVLADSSLSALERNRAIQKIIRGDFGDSVDAESSVDGEMTRITEASREGGESTIASKSAIAPLPSVGSSSEEEEESGSSGEEEETSSGEEASSSGEEEATSSEEEGSSSSGEEESSDEGDEWLSSSSESESEVSSAALSQKQSVPGAAVEGGPAAQVAAAAATAASAVAVAAAPPSKSAPPRLFGATPAPPQVEAPEGPPSPGAGVALAAAITHQLSGDDTDAQLQAQAAEERERAAALDAQLDAELKRHDALQDSVFELAREQERREQEEAEFQRRASIEEEEQRAAAVARERQRAEEERRAAREAREAEERRREEEERARVAAERRREEEERARVVAEEARRLEDERRRLEEERRAQAAADEEARRALEEERRLHDERRREMEAEAERTRVLVRQQSEVALEEQRRLQELRRSATEDVERARAMARDATQAAEEQRRAHEMQMRASMQERATERQRLEALRIETEQEEQRIRELQEERERQRLEEEQEMEEQRLRALRQEMEREEQRLQSLREERERQAEERRIQEESEREALRIRELREERERQEEQRRLQEEQERGQAQLRQEREQQERRLRLLREERERQQRAMQEEQAQVQDERRRLEEQRELYQRLERERQQRQREEVEEARAVGAGPRQQYRPAAPTSASRSIRPYVHATSVRPLPRPVRYDGVSDEELNWRLDHYVSLSDFTIVVHRARPGPYAPDFDAADAGSIDLLLEPSGTPKRDVYYVHKAMIAVGSRRSELLGRRIRDAEAGGADPDAHSSGADVHETVMLEGAADTMSAVLDFCYYHDRDLDINVENAVPLLYIGKRYKIRALLEQAETYVMEHLESTNAMYFLLDSYLYQLDDVLARAIDVTASNLADTVDFEPIYRLPPELFRRIVLSRELKCDGELLSLIVYSYCGEHHANDVDVECFRELTKDRIMPNIDSKVALMMLKFYVDLILDDDENCNLMEVLQGDSLATRCVTVVAKHWQGEVCEPLMIDNEWDSTPGARRHGSSHEPAAQHRLLPPQLQNHLLEKCILEARANIDSDKGIIDKFEEEKRLEMETNAKNFALIVKDLQAELKKAKTAHQKESDDYRSQMEQLQLVAAQLQSTLEERNKTLEEYRQELRRFRRVPGIHNFGEVAKDDSSIIDKTKCTYSANPDHHYPNHRRGNRRPTQMPSKGTELENLGKENGYIYDNGKGDLLPVFYYQQR